MSDWQRVIESCKMAELKEPENMYEVSECIDDMRIKINELKEINTSTNKAFFNFLCERGMIVEEFKNKGECAVTLFNKEK